MLPKEYVEDLAEQITGSKVDIAKLKLKLCKKYHTKRVPTDIEIMLSAPEWHLSKLKRYLKAKPGRSISGVAPVAVMTSPADCPHGKCAMCPGGLGSEFGDVPQSYTGSEPATMRGKRAGYDAYTQIFNRLEQYVCLGHVSDKVELIVMGGTFPARDREYRDGFIAACLKAMNDFSDTFFTRDGIDVGKFKEFFELPGSVRDETRTASLKKKIVALAGKSGLEAEQKRNERSRIRCVGLTVETRPDWAHLEHAREMLRLGCTRVELGVQSVYDDALDRINRGHTVQDSIDSIRELKDLGFKLNFHMMLGLPGVDKKKDLLGLKKLFTNKAFRPDMLKIYPCMVMKGTKLHSRYVMGQFHPISTDAAADVICDFKKNVPEYCRIMRVQRDIPTYKTEAGVDRTNLRQYVDEKCRQNKIQCRCIRCRESGRFEKVGKASIKVDKYEASKGQEYFISAVDDKDILVGFCRMRFPSQVLVQEITEKSVLIRELHVYGEAVPIGTVGKGQQHKGYGRKLLEKAEKIAKKEGKDKIVVISGVGVREYYRSLGYRKEGPYMVKRI